MHWFEAYLEVENEQRPPIEDILAYLNLVGRFLTTTSERETVMRYLSAVLEAANLPVQYATQVYVHRAINYGYLKELGKAADDYRQAWQLNEAQKSAEDYALTAARILLGAGNIDRERASRIASPQDQPARTELLEQAREAYLQAARLAEDYKLDEILTIVIYTELSWCYALLLDWDKAISTYHKALAMLPGIEDAQVRQSYKARILETAGMIYWEKGQSLYHAQPDSLQAFQAYQTAYDLAKEELDMLEGTLGELNALTIAHLNAGDYQMALSELPHCPDPAGFVRKAHEHWRTALALTQAWGLSDLAQEAQERLA